MAEGTPRRRWARNPYEDASLWSRFSYAWVRELLEQGNALKDGMSEADLPPVARADAVEELTGRLLRCWKTEQASAKKAQRKPSLFMALLRAFRRNFLLETCIASLETTFRVLLALLLGRLVQHFEDPDADIGEGFVIATLLVVFGFLVNATHHAYYWIGWRNGMQMRQAACGAIFRKSLTLVLSALSVVDTGGITNLAANDIERFQMLGIFLPWILIGPLEAIAILFLGIDLVGPAFAAGFGLVLLFVPVQSLFSRLFAKVRRRTAAASDKRIKLTTQAVEGARLMKMQAWEEAFEERIAALRADEIRLVREANRLRAYNEAMYFAMPVTVAFITFTVHEALGGELDIADVFASLALYNVVQLDMTKFFAFGVQAVTESRVSLLRVQAFLELPDHDAAPRAIEAGSATSSPAASEHLAQRPRIRLEDASYTWDDDFPTAQLLQEKKSAPVTTDDEARAPASPRRRDDTEAKDRDAPQDEETAMPMLPSPTRHAVDDGGETLVLKDLTLDIQQGELLVIVGPVGAGKTSLLLALLREMTLLDGRADTTGCTAGSATGVAYAPQESWIFSGTLRENVLFNAPFEEAVYQEVLRMCCLEEDIRSLASHDHTIVGDRGVALSGGQRARIGLARLCYKAMGPSASGAQRADLFLLDDPLSAVDPAVAAALFENVIVGLGERFGEKPSTPKPTRVLVTHQTQFLGHVAVDRVLVLDRDGTIAHCGPHAELVGQGVLAELEEAAATTVMTLNAEEAHSKGASSADPTADPPATETPGSQAKAGEADVASGSGELASGGGELLLEEKETGTVSLFTLKAYVRAMGSVGHNLLLALLLVAAQVAVLLSSVWLATWAEQDPADQGNDIYPIGLGILTGASILLGLARAVMAMDAFTTASKVLHAAALRRLLKAPMGFFDGTPLGRILNRFTKDVGYVEDLLPTTFFDFWQCLFMVLGTVALTCVANPAVLIVVVPLAVYFARLRKYFLNSSRPIKRVEALTRSPVFAYIAETLHGLPVIRASGLGSHIRDIFDERLNDNTRAYFSFIALNRWFGFQLDIIVILLLWATSFFSVFIKHVDIGYTVDGALLGTALVYILQLAGLFQWMVRQSAEVENQMVSTERIVAYSRLPQEAADPPAAPEAWPQSGAVEFRRVSARYRADLAPVLRDLSFAVPSGESCAIVGRTGAGKSSMVEALFRLIEPEDAEGRPLYPRFSAGADAKPGEAPGIYIDGVNTSSLPLSRLRAKIGVIPQTPFLFQGSVRDNLDPFRANGDDTIWSALRDVQMHDAVAAAGGLSMDVGHGGAKLSVGERQLLCLARAILDETRVLIMDEATANIDGATDHLIQATVRDKFGGRGVTTFVVAHRLATIIDADRVLVLSRGARVEFDSPHALLRRYCPGFEVRPGDVDALEVNADAPEAPLVSFAAMVKETGPETEKELRKAAKAAWDAKMRRGSSA